MPRARAAGVGRGDRVGVRGRGRRGGSAAPCRCATRGTAGPRWPSGRTPTSAAPARWSGRCGCCSSGASPSRAARRSSGGRSSATGPAASWPGGSGSRVEGTLRRYLPHRGDAAGRLGRDAAARRPARAAHDLARRAGAGGRRVPAAAGPGGRRAAHPRGHRGAGHPALARAQAGAVHPRRRARLRRAAPRARGHRRVRDLGDRRPRRRPAARHGPVVQLDAGVECEVGYWTHPEARGRGLATGRRGWWPATSSRRWGSSGSRRSPRPTTPRHAGSPRRAGFRLVRRRAVRRAGARRLGRHGALRRDGRGVGGRRGPARTPPPAPRSRPATAPRRSRSGDR